MHAVVSARPSRADYDNHSTWAVPQPPGEAWVIIRGRAPHPGVRLSLVASPSGRAYSRALSFPRSTRLHRFTGEFVAAER